MNERRRLDEDEGFRLRNAPMRPRLRREILERPGTVVIEGDDGEVIVTPDAGQLRLHWAFRDIDTMRHGFPEMWQEAAKAFGREAIDYVAMDLSGLPTREWLEPLLRDADFDFFAEWMEMSIPDLDEPAVPEFPGGVSMRKATEDDVDRLREIWTEAYGEYGDGEGSFDWLLAEAAWVGVLEADGEVVAFAMNSEVERREGRVLTAAVAPDHWGHGYGKLVLSAALYQLAANEAVRANIKVRPDIKQALKICSELGFRYASAGIEYRRTTDEAWLADRREQRRKNGVKARFGKWR